MKTKALNSSNQLVLATLVETGELLRPRSLRGHGPQPGNRELAMSFFPSFSVLGFPVSRLPSPKVARTARRIDNRRL